MKSWWEEEEMLIKGRKYENYVAAALRKIGYNIIYHGFIYGTKDKGIDLIAIQKSRKILLIQCKFRTNRCPNDDVDYVSIERMIGTKNSFLVEFRLFPEEVDCCYFTTSCLLEERHHFAATLGIYAFDNFINNSKEWTKQKYGSYSLWIPPIEYLSETPPDPYDFPDKRFRKKYLTEKFTQFGWQHLTIAETESNTIIKLIHSELDKLDIMIKRKETMFSEENEKLQEANRALVSENYDLKRENEKLGKDKRYNVAIFCLLTFIALICIFAIMSR